MRELFLHPDSTRAAAHQLARSAESSASACRRCLTAPLPPLPAGLADFSSALSAAVTTTATQVQRCADLVADLAEATLRDVDAIVQLDAQEAHGLRGLDSGVDSTATEVRS